MTNQQSSSKDEEQALYEQWVSEGRDPELFPMLGQCTQEDMAWAISVIKSLN